jgi:glycosyltransferase involved in cell wall biosynthesis
VVKRVAFAVPGDLAAPTGGYAYDRRMIVELARLGWGIDVINLGADFPRPSATQRKTARRLLMEVPAGLPIVIDGLAYGVLPELAAELATDHPLVALVHHPLALESGLSADEAEELRASERLALGKTTRVIVTSATTARLLEAEYNVAVDRITVVSPGTDPVSPARGSGDGIVRLLAIGAIVPRKGYDVFIEALASLIDLPWHLTIAGDNTRNREAAARLDADISRFRLGERVTVLGAVSDARLAELFVDAHIFALASRYEGYGMVFSEAVAHGLPVIGTRAGAIPETVPAEAGILVPPDDAAALANALRRVIENPDKRVRMAAAAREAARNLPTWQDSAKIFAGVLEALA